MPVAKFIKETRRELTKVTWPTRDEVIQMTSLVIIVSLAVGIYIGALDFGFSKLLESII
jgi:preprotein translocase subunit SecE